MSASWHDIALVCRKGHVINGASRKHPEFNSAFCQHCGSEALSQCTRCQAHVRGEYHVEGVVVIGGEGFKPPAYCDGCGAAYPWTEARVRALTEYLELVGADPAERAWLSSSVGALMADSPETPLAVARWKRYLGKADKDVTVAVRDILADVMSDAAKSGLFGP
jgi:hypothetical protein